MLFNIKTLKYFKKKRTKLYIFLKSLKKKNDYNEEIWSGIINTFSRFNKMIKIKTVKKKDDFIIYKEKYTNSWFLECKGMIIIYILKDDNDNFEEKIIENSKYSFIIYETTFHYIYFCTSHSTEQIDDCLKKLFLDYTDKRILLLPCCLSTPSVEVSSIKVSNCGINFTNFIFLNKFLYEDSNCKYSVKKLQFRNEDLSLILKVQIIIQYIIECKHLSPHYFPIN